MGEQTAIEWTARRSGPPPAPAREGDKRQARRRVNHEVETGRRPHPNTLPCADCGHVWIDGERRHEYDHHLGYDAAHHGDVQAVCTTCHHLRDGYAGATHCKHGHAFTPENTYVRAHPPGRMCRECERTKDRSRRDAAWWRNRRAQRKVTNG